MIQMDVFYIPTDTLEHDLYEESARRFWICTCPVSARQISEIIILHSVIKPYPLQSFPLAFQRQTTLEYLEQIVTSLSKQLLPVTPLCYRSVFGMFRRMTSLKASARVKLHPTLVNNKSTTIGHDGAYCRSIGCGNIPQRNQQPFLTTLVAF
jgi:hypothetical protein